MYKATPQIRVFEIEFVVKVGFSFLPSIRAKRKIKDLSNLEFGNANWGWIGADRIIQCSDKLPRAHGDVWWSIPFAGSKQEADVWTTKSHFVGISAKDNCGFSVLVPLRKGDVIQQEGRLRFRIRSLQPPPNFGIFTGEENLLFLVGGLIQRPLSAQWRVVESESRPLAKGERFSPIAKSAYFNALDLLVGGETVRAEDLINRAMKEVGGTESRWVAGLYYLKGRICVRHDRHGPAKRYFREAIEYSLTTFAPAFESASRFEIAKLLANEGEYDHSLKFADRAFRIEDLRDFEHLVDFIQFCCGVLAINGKEEHARSYYKFFAEHIYRELASPTTTERRGAAAFFAASMFIVLGEFGRALKLVNNQIFRGNSKDRLLDSSLLLMRAKLTLLQGDPVQTKFGLFLSQCIDNEDLYVVHETQIVRAILELNNTTDDTALSEAFESEAKIFTMIREERKNVRFIPYRDADFNRRLQDRLVRARQDGMGADQAAALLSYWAVICLSSPRWREAKDLLDLLHDEVGAGVTWAALGWKLKAIYYLLSGDEYTAKHVLSRAESGQKVTYKNWLGAFADHSSQLGSYYREWVLLETKLRTFKCEETRGKVDHGEILKGTGEAAYEFKKRPID